MRSDILHSCLIPKSDFKHLQLGVQQVFIVPDSATLHAFANRKGSGSVSTGVEIPECPSVS